MTEKIRVKAVEGRTAKDHLGRVVGVGPGGQLVPKTSHIWRQVKAGALTIVGAKKKEEPGNKPKKNEGEN